MSNMTKEALKELFTRDLLRLKKEIELYSDEKALWITDKEVKNCSGNLCLHIIGNLKSFIGHGLGHSGYVRDREFEFGGKDVPRAQLITEIGEAITAVSVGLDQLTPESLQGNFSIQIWKEETGMTFTLIHLHSHLNYHLGQINYHRRLLDGSD